MIIIVSLEIFFDARPSEDDEIAALFPLGQVGIKWHDGEINQQDGDQRPGGDIPPRSSRPVFNTPSKQFHANEVRGHQGFLSFQN